MACVYLGHWYREVSKDLRKAKNCYEEALLLDPEADGAAECLKRVNQDLGLNSKGSKTAGKALLDGGAPSAFAAQSKKGFEELSPKGNACSAAEPVLHDYLQLAF